MVAYTKPPQRKKEESERLRGEGDKIGILRSILDYDENYDDDNCDNGNYDEDGIYDDYDD